MSTSIQWTDETWNPTTGCTRVSEGCRNCYIERTPPFRMNNRTFANGKAEPIQHIERLNAPLAWRKPRRVFVNSLSDLFHDMIPDEFILNVFTVMAIASEHTYQILTKRPQRMKALLSKWRADDLYTYWHAYTGGPMGAEAWPLPNVWLGVSVEDQATADERIPILLDVPSAIRFISAEPLLGLVDLNKRELLCRTWRKGFTIGRYLDWVIVGGESGPGARSCDIAWVRSLKEQCQHELVPVFVKQLGSKVMTDIRTRRDSDDWVQLSCLKDKKGGDMAEWPEDLRVRQYPTACGVRVAGERLGRSTT